MDCCICYDSITKQTGKCELACGHLFHISCHIQWSQSHETCPMCRAKFSKTERSSTPLDFSVLFHDDVPPKAILRFTELLSIFSGDLYVYKPTSIQNLYDEKSDTDNIGFHDISEMTQGILCMHTKNKEIYNLLTIVFADAFPRAVITKSDDGTQFTVPPRS